MDKNIKEILNEKFLKANNFLQENKPEKAIPLYKEIISINSENYEVFINLALSFAFLNKLNQSLENYEIATKLNPGSVEAYYNKGVICDRLGLYHLAVKSYTEAIKLNPENSEIYNNRAVSYLNMYSYKESKNDIMKSIELKDSAHSYWNLLSFSNDINESIITLEKCLSLDKNFIRAKMCLSALNKIKNNDNLYKELLRSNLKNHPHMKSYVWYFSLNKKINLFFNKKDFFDAIIKSSDKSRVYYEFGVWRGLSFKYIVKNYKYGYGFDNFKGLPEDWESIKKNEYSSYGDIPKISNGEFIEGNFDKSLPIFFSKQRPLASIINFDCDLYSSTITALNNSKDIIDNKTILIFDEFLMNKNWINHEYKALTEFCSINNYEYDVVAISFLTKQVAVKVFKN